MSNNRSLDERNRTSYKPSVNELHIRDEFNELKHGLFKGIVPKIIRMSGQLYQDLDELMTTSKELSDAEEKTLLQKLMRSMDEANKRHVRDSKKKHIFITGRRKGKFQILITEHVLPIPHVTGVSVALITAELNIVGTDEYAFKSSRWGLMVDDDMDPKIRDHYVQTVNLKDLYRYSSYYEIMKHIIFQVTPYQIK
jgi:hypothetical protein